MPSIRAGSPVRRRALASRPSVFNFPSRPLTQVQVTAHDQTVNREVLVDSGADADLLDWSMVKRLDIKTEILPQPITARALDGKMLFNVTHVTEPICYEPPLFYWHSFWLPLLEQVYFCSAFCSHLFSLCLQVNW